MTATTIGFAIALLALSALISVSLLLVVCVALVKQLNSTHKAWAEARNAYMTTSTDMARRVRVMEGSPVYGEKPNGEENDKDMRQKMGERYQQIVEEQAVRDRQAEAKETAGDPPGATFEVDPNRM